MILYKNVDICDLKSIMEKGILSLDACGNNNWDDGKRGENSTSVVYLFQPLTKENSFPEYGAALLEIDCSADRSEMPDFDVHKGKYEEYITEQVLPSQIRRIFIPKIFRPYIEAPTNLDICWCQMEADYYGDGGLEKCSSEILEQFARTAPFMSAKAFNFFRGMNKDRTMIDLYNIIYSFEYTSAALPGMLFTVPSESNTSPFEFFHLLNGIEYVLPTNANSSPRTSVFMP